MLVTITEFSRLAIDSNGAQLPLGAGRIACQAVIADGDANALTNGTRFVRVATDTAIQINIAGGSTTSSDELFPANSVEYIAVRGGETLAIATA
jgi:hypothetical protein